MQLEPAEWRCPSPKFNPPQIASAINR
jgi:hypothetical protein